MKAGDDLQVRPAVLTDTQHIADLLRTSPTIHRHLDWRNPLDWIGTPPFFVIENHGEILAALGCPPEPPSIAWLRLFVNSGMLPVEESWQRLWEKARTELTNKSPSLAAAIVLHEWLHGLLLFNGFTSHQSIVMLERNDGNPPELELPTGITLRAMLPFDLPAVAEVDSSAFELLWQNALPVLERAYPQAIWATVAEMDNRVVGYQLSTRSPVGVHLARLGVYRDLQGKGLGYTLVASLIQQASQHGISHLTVNTQSDNARSLALYSRLDFHETGERYPVYELQVS